MNLLKFSPLNRCRTALCDHFKHLVELAKVDGEVPAETNLISDMARRENIPDELLEKIRKRPDAFRDGKPETPMERTKQLYDLIMLVLCDGKVSQSEKYTLHARANQIGFSHEDVDRLIELLQEEVEKQSNGGVAGLTSGAN